MLASLVSPYRAKPLDFHEPSAARSSKGIREPLWASDAVVMMRAGATGRGEDPGARHGSRARPRRGYCRGVGEVPTGDIGWINKGDGGVRVGSEPHDAG